MIGKFFKLFSVFNIHIFNISLSPNFFRNILPIKVEPEIDLNSYLGNWTQVATSRSTKLFGTGIDFRNVSADYQLLNNNNISVFNCGLDGQKNYTSIKGYSYSKNKLANQAYQNFIKAGSISLESITNLKSKRFHLTSQRFSIKINSIRFSETPLNS